MHAESMEDLEKAAQAQGVSFEEFKQTLKNSILTQKVIQQEVGGHISVSQQEIQEFYDQHKAEMQRPEQIRLSEILISTQAAQPAAGQPACPEASNDELTSSRLHFSCPNQADLNFPVASIQKAHKDGIELKSGEKYHFIIANRTKDQVEAIFVSWLNRVQQFPQQVAAGAF